MPRHSAESYDENPQLMNMLVTETAANTYTELGYDVPVVSNIGEKVQVMEILRIILSETVGDLATGDGITVSIHDRPKTAMPGFTDAGVLAQHYHILTVAGAAGAYHTELPKFVYDYTDGKGNGIIYARKKIYIGVQGVSQAAAVSGKAKILYRLKEIDAKEFIGFVAE